VRARRDLVDEELAVFCEEELDREDPDEVHLLDDGDREGRRLGRDGGVDVRRRRDELDDVPAVVEDALGGLVRLDVAGPAAAQMTLSSLKRSTLSSRTHGASAKCSEAADARTATPLPS